MNVRLRKEVVADFFAHGYRLSGTFDARQRSFGDAIYDRTTDYLKVENVYISSIGNPAEINISRPCAIIAKNEVSFVLIMDENDALRRDQKYGSYLPPQIIPVLISLPFFELKGHLRIPGRLEPRTLLSSQTESFLTLLNVTARTTFDSAISFAGAAALVNKTKIGFLGLESL